MQVLDSTKILSELCKATKRWGLFISGWNWDIALKEDGNKILAAPYLDFESEQDCMLQVMGDCQGYLMFDTEEEMLKYYDMTVGDDGPTELNKYNGKNKIYALTCGPDGQFQNENT